MRRVFKHMTMADRIKIETLLKAGYSKREIADILHVHRSTIYREIKKGLYTAMKSDLTMEERYSPDIAYAVYRENMSKTGARMKIGSDIEFANYIEHKIVDEGYSPEAVLGELKATGQEKRFSVTICTKTLYSYIDKGIFLRLTNKNLPVKGKRRRKYRKVRQTQARASAGESIENRPEGVLEREEFGHWEMDTVKGKKKKSKSCLLVLTERKTRGEIIAKLPDGTAVSVVAALDRMETKWGVRFREVFKTITVDNGSEFSWSEGIERSALGEEERTKAYYCHPYSSYERGTNEVANRMIRRHIPKGADIDAIPEEEIQRIEDWINNYPRKIHGFRTARELFLAEVGQIT